MKSLSRLLVVALILLTSCYGNPKQEDESIKSEIKTDSTLVPVDSAERDHTESTKSDTVSGKTGHVNGL